MADNIKIDRDHGHIVLFKRNDSNQWQCRIRIKGASGYTRRGTGETDEYKARKWADNLYDSLVTKFKTSGTTTLKPFTAVVDEYLKSEKDNDSYAMAEATRTLNTYACEYFGKTPIDSINEAALLRFVMWRKNNGRANKACDSTVIRELTPLRNVFNHAFTEGYISERVPFPDLTPDSTPRPHF